MIMVDIEVLKAQYGDCIFVAVTNDGQEYVIMIDGGLDTTYQERRRRQTGPLKEKLEQLKQAGKHIDLLIITHVDYDHIGGVLKWFNTNFPDEGFVKRVWINDDVKIEDQTNLDNNAAHEASLLKLLARNNVTHENQIVSGKETAFDWGKIYVLAPTTEDHNRMSDKVSANLDNKENNNYKKKYSSILNPITLIIEGFKKVINYSFLKKILLAGFFLSGRSSLPCFSSYYWYGYVQSRHSNLLYKRFSRTRIARFNGDLCVC